MRIAKTQGFLTLRSDPSDSKPTVAISNSLASVIADWTSGTRVSPIWGLGGAGPTRHKFDGSNSLVFIGPVSPARLFTEVDLRGRPGNLNMWVGLGTFNLILRTDETEDGRATVGKVCRWAANSEIPCEHWIVKDGLVTRWRAYPLNIPRARSAFKALAKLARLSFRNSLNIHAQEFLVLMASALSRAASIDRRVHSDLVQVAEEVAVHIKEAMAKPNEVLDVSAELININAALSRFTSQAFSGISPIASTECHFWIHSLLGTGSANIALAKLVQFITTRLGHANLPERFLALKQVTRNVPNYDQLVGDEEFLWRDHVGNVTLSSEEMNEPLQPIITYFSGRDGYNSQLQTLSAPLTSIAQANSVQTNILTVTHEISHVFVEGILGYLYPDPDDEHEIAELTKFITSEREPDNLFEAARKLLIEAMIAMQQLHQTDKIVNSSITSDQMLEMLTTWRREAKEIMVHTFDYLYFFQNDPKRYIENIWSTWCAIPGISERVPEYILRTLCAISARILKLKPSERRDTARKIFEQGLVALSADPTLPTDYAVKALRHLRENWSVRKNGNPSIAQRYDIWLYLVRLTAAFMYSERVAAELFSERHVGYKKQSHLYDDHPLGNPIRFVREHLTKTPEEAESVWLLHNVAYCLRS